MHLSDLKPPLTIKTVKKFFLFFIKDKGRARLSLGLLVMTGVIGLSCLITPALVKADRLESESYIIQFGNFNTGAGKTNEERAADGEPFSHQVSYTMGQTAAGPYGDFGAGGSTYFIGSGFQYIYQIEEFQFSISDIQLEFDNVLAGSHHTNTNQLTVNTRGAGGFSVFAYELAPLTSSAGSTIPDTTCDSTTDPCDETEAKPWINEDVPGFGFNVHGTTAASDFQLSDSDCSLESSCSDQGEENCPTDCYRQFADISSGTETMQPVMSSLVIAENESVTVTYQLGISPAQPAGNYETGIVYVAVPGY